MSNSKEKMTEEEREELVFVLSMRMPMYSEEYFRKLTDAELIEKERFHFQKSI